MTTHVFIVDYRTFKIHLECLFAGTGARDEIIDFNNRSATKHEFQIENMFVGLMADSSRVRKGDYIIFYLQQNIGGGILEGKFFGIFQAKDDCSFLDNNDNEQYLKEELGKSLTCRTLIKPLEIYPEGVTEWEALDSIRDISSPHQMLWSLIYRKLKGNRGNTMITIYEAERLMQLIRNKNGKKEINVGNKVLSFDREKQRLIILDGKQEDYIGRKEDINILPRMVEKYGRNNAFEGHLQAYIVGNLGKRINKDLDNLIVGSSRIEWLGNEVSCGVGMQRIDIMVSLFRSRKRVVVPIELKAVKATESHTKQLQRYVDWIEQYYIPNRPSDIQPILITKKIETKNAKSVLEKMIMSFNEFNERNKKSCLPLKYIEFSIRDKANLVFEETAY